MTTMTFQDIKNTIYQYFPKNIYDTEPGYRDTTEFKNLMKVCQTAEKDNKLWNIFLKDISEEFKGCELEDYTQFFHFDRCYRCKINLPQEFKGVNRSLVIHVSILAPFTSVYLSEVRLKNGRYSQPEISFQSNRPEDNNYYSYALLSFQKQIQYEILDLKLVTAIIPDVAVGNQLLNEATVFHCLFTDHII